MTPPVGRAFGAWAEQLIAETTGKLGKGIVPVEGEALGDPADYGDDRVFVYVGADLPDRRRRRTGRHAIQARLEAPDAGHPVIRLAMNDRYDLGEQFCSGRSRRRRPASSWASNAFDQPNVARIEGQHQTRCSRSTHDGQLHEPEATAAQRVPALSPAARLEQRCISAASVVEARSRRSSRRSSRATTSRSPRTSQRNENHAALHETARRRSATRCERRDDGRLRSALPALDRATAQGRPPTPASFLQITADRPDDLADSRHERRLPHAARARRRWAIRVARQARTPRRARPSHAAASRTALSGARRRRRRRCRG